MKPCEFSLQMGTVIVLVFVSVCFPLYGGAAPSVNLGSGQPGLKIDYKGTNQFVIYLDERWTVGEGFIGGYDERHIDVLLDRNYGLKGMIQTRKWDGYPHQLYPFDDQRGFTCESAKLGLDPKTLTHWPHQTQVFTIDGDSLSVSDDVYVLARHQYGLTTNQFFLGKIGTNIFYWETQDSRRVFYRPAAGEGATNYFEFPKGILDFMGVTQGVKEKDNIGFTVLRKSKGFSYSPNEFTFIEVSYKNAKPVKGNQ